MALAVVVGAVELDFLWHPVVKSSTAVSHAMICSYWSCTPNWLNRMNSANSAALTSTIMNSNVTSRKTQLFFSNKLCLHFPHVPKDGILCTREALIRHAHRIDEIFLVNHLGTSSDGGSLGYCVRTSAAIWLFFRRYWESSWPVECRGLLCAIITCTCASFHPRLLPKG